MTHVTNVALHYSQSRIILLSLTGASSVHPVFETSCLAHLSFSDWSFLGSLLRGSTCKLLRRVTTNRYDRKLSSGSRQ